MLWFCRTNDHCKFFFKLQFFLVLLVIFGLEISAATSGYHHREKVGFFNSCH